MSYPPDPAPTVRGLGLHLHACQCPCHALSRAEREPCSYAELATALERVRALVTRWHTDADQVDAALQTAFTFCATELDAALRDE